MNNRIVGVVEMINRGFIAGVCGSALLFAASQNSLAQEAAQSSDIQAVQTELENAKQAVEEARRAAEQIVLDAKRDAALIRQSADHQQAPTDLTPVEIQNSPVAVELSAGTVKEIATAIMPAGWRVLIDVKDQSVLQRRFQFVSTKSRDQALRDLLKPVGLKHQYFFDLKNAQGQESPLLVISKR